MKCCPIKCADLAAMVTPYDKGAMKAALNADVFLFTLLLEIIAVQRSASSLSVNILKIFVEYMLTQICAEEVRLERNGE